MSSKTEFRHRCEYSMLVFDEVISFRYTCETMEEGREVRGTGGGRRGRGVEKEEGDE